MPPPADGFAGFASLTGALADVPDFDGLMREVEAARASGLDRPVDLETWPADSHD